MFGVLENKTKQRGLLFSECKYLRVNSTEILVSGDPGKTVVSLMDLKERGLSPPRKELPSPLGLGYPLPFGVCAQMSSFHWVLF